MKRDVLQLAKDGDNQAFSDLVQQSFTKAYAIAYGILKNEQDALDAVQDSYITAYRGMQNLNNLEAFDGWFCRIVSNTSIDYYRKNSRHRKHIEEDDEKVNAVQELDEAFIPHLYLERENLRTHLQSIIHALPDEQRIAVMLMFYQGYSVKEVAEFMRCGVKTVYSRVTYAKRHIKKEIEKRSAKGETLYQLQPLALIGKLLMEQQQKDLATRISAKEISRQATLILEKLSTTSTTAAAGSAASATAAQTAAGGGGVFHSLHAGVLAQWGALSAASKVVAGIAAALVVGTAVTVPAVLLSGNDSVVAVGTQTMGESSHEMQEETRYNGIPSRPENGALPHKLTDETGLDERTVRGESGQSRDGTLSPVSPKEHPTGPDVRVDPPIIVERPVAQPDNEPWSRPWAVLFPSIESSNLSDKDHGASSQTEAPATQPTKPPSLGESG